MSAPANPRSWLRSDVAKASTIPRIAYRAGAPSNGMPVVLLHSLGADQSTWGPMVEALGDQHRVVTIDSRGHGDSGSAHGTGPMTWGWDVVAVLDELRIRQAVLVGVSMGGLQAIVAAADFPERIAGLVIADSFAVLPDETLAARIQDLTEISTMPMDAVADRYVAETFGGAGDERGPALVRSAMGSMSRRNYLVAAAAVYEADVTDDLAAIEADTLVLWGELDDRTPRAFSEHIAAGIQNAYFATIPGAGHLSHLDQPEDFAALVSEFVEFVSNPPPSGGRPG